LYKHHNKEVVMRLRTIWTIPAMPIRERLNRTADVVLLAIAHRLPRGLAYWSFIDTGVRNMLPDDVVPDVKYGDILSRMER
jgi:hypothetical protein